MVPVAPRRAAARPRARRGAGDHGADRRHGGRFHAPRVRRVALPGPDRRRRDQHRRAARRARPGRSGVGSAAVRPLEAARRCVPPVDRDAAGDVHRHGRRAHRPRDGSVPPVLGASRRRRRATSTSPPTSCSRSSPSRPTAPARSSSARTSARCRPRCPRRCAAHGMLGTRVAMLDELPPAQWPTTCVATLTTHDLPTMAGVLERRGLDRDARPAGDDDGCVRRGGSHRRRALRRHEHVAARPDRRTPPGPARQPRRCSAS